MGEGRELAPGYIAMRAGWLLALAAALVICIVLLLRGEGAQRDGFASERARAVAAGAREVFEGGDASYAGFARRVPEADPVLHSDARRLWRAGALTPEAVDAVL